MKPTANKLDWQFVNFWLDEVMYEGQNLARISGAMGLRRLVTLERIDIPDWRPEYHRNSIHFDREGVAAINRGRRGSPVLVLVNFEEFGTPPAVITLDYWNLDWRTASGGACGAGIVSLATWRLGISTGKAAWWIARVCGYEGLPHGR